jgi:hypothetical protein
MIQVPFAEKDDAKALGARWDSEAQSWFVPAGRDLALFNRWIPRPVRIDGPTIPARLVGPMERCYRCTSRGVALAGILVSPAYSLDPCGFIGFDFVARVLAELVNDTPLAELYDIGRIRLRSSQARPEGYVANACRYCDTLWGSFPLQESLTEYLAEGGSYSRLVIAELAFPVSGLPDLRATSDWSERQHKAQQPSPPAGIVRIVPRPTRSADAGTVAGTTPACTSSPTTVPNRGWRPWRR